MPWIGVDLGGTKIYGVVLDEGKVLAETKRKTPPVLHPLVHRHPHYPDLHHRHSH